MVRLIAIDVTGAQAICHDEDNDAWYRISLDNLWQGERLDDEDDARRCAQFGLYLTDVGEPATFATLQELSAEVRRRCLAEMEEPDVVLDDLPPGVKWTDLDRLPGVDTGPDIREPVGDLVMIPLGIDKAVVLNLQQIVDKARRHEPANLPADSVNELATKAGAVRPEERQVSLGQAAAPLHAATRGADLDKPYRRTGDEVVIRIPIEHAPFGVLRVFVREVKTGDVVETFLMAVAKNNTQSHRVTSVSLAGRDDKDKLEVVVQPATADADILSLFPLGELQSLLETDAAAVRDEVLRREIESLVQLLEKTGTTEGHARRPLHFIWIIDTSASMSGEKIETVNYAIRKAIPQMRAVAQENPNTAVWIRVLRFGSVVEWHVREPVAVDDFQWKDLSVGGVTNMGKALAEVSTVLKMPPMESRALPPVLVLLSDGRPTDDFHAGLRTLLAEPWGQRAIRFAISIGRDTDDTVLRQFISHEEIPPLKADDPESLVRHIRWVSTVVVQHTSSSASEVAHDAPKPVANLPIPEPKSDDISPPNSGW